MNQEVYATGRKGKIRELRRQESPFSGLVLIEFEGQAEKVWFSAEECRDEEEEQVRLFANQRQASAGPTAVPLSAEELRVVALRAQKAKLEAAIEAKKLEAEIAALNASNQ